MSRRDAATLLILTLFLISGMKYVTINNSNKKA
jgi:hypothetical protein